MEPLYSDTCILWAIKEHEVLHTTTPYGPMYF